MMKSRPVFIITMIILSMSLVLSVAMAEETNLLVNGGFEQWKDRPETNEIIPVGWWPIRSEYEEMSRVSDLKVSGDYGIKIVTSVRKGRYLIQSDPFKVTPGKVYKISYWVYVEEGSVGVGVLNKTTDRWASSTISNPKNSQKDGKFKYGEISIKASNDAKEFQLIFSSLNEPGMRTTFYLDDITVVEMSN